MQKSFTFEIYRVCAKSVEVGEAQRMSTMWIQANSRTLEALFCFPKWTALSS